MGPSQHKETNIASDHYSSLLYNYSHSACGELTTRPTGRGLYACILTYLHTHTYTLWTDYTCTHICLLSVYLPTYLLNLLTHSYLPTSLFTYVFRCMYTKTHTSKKDAAKEMGGRLITAHLERREIPPSECVTGVLTSRDVRTLVTPLTSGILLVRKCHKGPHVT